jgi:hypothetical protein
MINILKKYALPLVVLFFFLLYLLLPTTNSSIDAWGFAAYVKHGKDLFLSHHLFYNAIGFLWVKLIGLIFTFDTLKLLIALNAIFAAASLYMLGKTLKLLNIDGIRLIAWVAFAGSSWAVMRFATENETYIIPLFFSLVGSFYFVKSLTDNVSRNYFYAGLFAAAACLFHQVMFFWWIALLVGVAYKRKVKPFVWFALPALIVPISYILVLVFYYNQPLTFGSLMQFVFRDYYSGAAGVSAGSNSILFSVISLVRTFFQVHGYFVYLPRFSILYIIGGSVSIGFLIVALIYLIEINWTFKKIKNITIWIHLLAFALQLVFAFLSSGNAEFMVMIPFLLAIILSQITSGEARFVGFVSLGMLTWNLTLGLLPLHRNELDSNRKMSDMVLASQQNKKKELFVLFNKPAVENRVKYFMGDYPKNIVSGIQYDNPNKIKQRISNASSNDTTVYADCINRPTTLSRETMTITNKSELFGGFKIVRVDSFKTLTGKYYLYAISK